MPSTSAGQPDSRPIIAFFDVDNTLVRGASIFHVGRVAWDKRLITLRDILTFAWHQISFLAVGENRRHMSRAKDRALELAGGHTAKDLIDLASETYDRDIARRIWPETVELAREHQRKGHEVWLISATPQLIGQVIAERLGLTGALGTEIEQVDGVFTGKLVGAVLHGEEKAIAAEKLVAERGALLADCWAYSDSRNDIPLLNLVGHRTVVNPDARLESYAKERGWAILPLKPSSLRSARRRVKREAKAVRTP
jgi:HAD superfamily hydrolase (TIGR01490 family)